jgi:hypothetical protein
MVKEWIIEKNCNIGDMFFIAGRRLSRNKAKKLLKRDYNTYCTPDTSCSLKGAD